jgi:FAD/FMN-containing dehydrogenase
VSADVFLRELPSDLYTVEPSELVEYGRDWTRVYEPHPSAVVFPRTAADVSRVLRLASQHAVAVVPSGGRTGLAGGAVARNGEIVLSLSRMRAMGEVDTVGATVRVEAGAVTEAVHQHVAPYGLTWPVDFASKGSSQVGGNIATNAGGVKVIRYGLTRQWVLGLEVALASGELLTLGGALEKDNTGLDLRQLFIGSEGTLGVITAATLKLAHLPKKLDVMLFGVPDVAGVVRLFQATRKAPFTLAAYEFFTPACLARVQRHRKVKSPLAAEHGAYVLVELEDARDDELETWFGQLFEEGIIEDGTRAQHASQARELWTLREGISESLSATGMPHKNDISIPVAALEAFVADLGQLLAARYQGWEICLFGHVGDGNLHVNVMKPDDMDKATFLAKTSELDQTMFPLVQKHRGSISAEHGIGLLKKPYLGFTRPPEQIALMRQVKKLLDPQGILNPGKIFDPVTGS